MSEDIPFDDDDQFDDYRIGGGYADGKSSEQIADEASFPPVPDGRNLFYIKKIALKTDAENGNEVLVSAYEAWTDPDETGKADTLETIHCRDAIVTWALVDNPKLTVNEYFRLPPDDEDEAEIFAKSASKEGGRMGMDYNRLRHALTGLGFNTQDGTIPEEAQSLGAWKRWEDGSPRLVSLNITPQMDKATNYKQPKMAPNGHPFKQVQMFSHLRSEDTLERLGLDQPAEDAGDSEPEPEPAKPAPKPAPAKSAASKPAPKPAPAKPAPAKGGVPKGMKF